MERTWRPPPSFSVAMRTTVVPTVTRDTTPVAAVVVMTLCAAPHVAPPSVERDTATLEPVSTAAQRCPFADRHMAAGEASLSAAVSGTAAAVTVEGLYAS